MSLAWRFVVRIFLTTSMISPRRNKYLASNDDDNTTKPMAQRLR
jgi:hypothetical protein